MFHFAVLIAASGWLVLLDKCVDSGDDNDILVVD